jgi:hypothetical protein
MSVSISRDVSAACWAVSFTPVRKNSCNNSLADHIVAAYPALAKVFYVPGQFYEYVTYMNPGRGEPFIFSASINSQKSEATEKQLGAYESTLASLKLLNP